tara:strand:- start:329 stop:523 length:195 start_codon:yes stop_codon:yes gene_type:complete
LGYESHVIKSTDPNNRGNLFNGVGSHDGVARALVSPCPVDLICSAQIVIDEHMGRTNCKAEFLD